MTPHLFPCPMCGRVVEHVTVMGSVETAVCECAGDRAYIVSAPPSIEDALGDAARICIAERGQYGVRFAVERDPYCAIWCVTFIRADDVFCRVDIDDMLIAADPGKVARELREALDALFCAKESRP